MLAAIKHSLAQDMMHVFRQTMALYLAAQPTDGPVNVAEKTTVSPNRLLEGNKSEHFEQFINVLFPILSEILRRHHAILTSIAKEVPEPPELHSMEYICTAMGEVLEQILTECMNSGQNSVSAAQTYKKASVQGKIFTFQDQIPNIRRRKSSTLEVYEKKRVCTATPYHLVWVYTKIQKHINEFSVGASDPTMVEPLRERMKNLVRRLLLPKFKNDPPPADPLGGICHLCEISAI